MYNNRVYYVDCFDCCIPKLPSLHLGVPVYLVHTSHRDVHTSHRDHLMPTIEERVPSRSKLGQNGVLFFCIKLKSRFSAALEFGITKIDSTTDFNLATLWNQSL